MSPRRSCLWKRGCSHLHFGPKHVCLVSSKASCLGMDWPPNSVMGMEENSKTAQEGNHWPWKPVRRETIPTEATSVYPMVLKCLARGREAGSSAKDRNLHQELQLAASTSPVGFCWMSRTPGLMLSSLSVAVCSFTWKHHRGWGGRREGGGTLICPGLPLLETPDGWLKEMSLVGFCWML